jgi:glycine/D-amino acid oxidase-like deaminating enzyme
MSTAKQIDSIIVGQGLAGSALALQLIKRNKKILVIDRLSANSPSRIAVGLFNPITGRHMVKTWLADQLFPYLHDFYKKAEMATQSQFFYPRALYRPFATAEEQNEWMAKSADAIYDDYIESIFTKPTHPSTRDIFGGLLLKQSGYLDTIQYLNSVRMFIQTKGILLDEFFQEDELLVEKEAVRYRNYQAGNIIFCQGMESNKWFNWVPVLPLKGETIRIQSDQQENIILNRGVYAVPINQNGRWRVGATYSWTDVAPGNTEVAKAELTSKLNELVSFNYRVLDQEWGIRPTTHDRRPILGRHPEHKVLYIFNGMGPKGVSLAPYFSEILVQFIENHQSLNKDVNIERYKLLYWSPSTRI